MQCTVNKLHSKQTIPTNRKKQKNNYGAST